MPQLTQEQLEKLSSNAPKIELKRPVHPNTQQEPQEHPANASADTGLALQEAIGDEAALTQEVIQAAQSQGANLAVKSNVAQFNGFVTTNAKLSKQRRKAYQQLVETTAQATDSIEVEAAEDCSFFTSVSASLGSVSLSLPGRSGAAALPPGNGNSSGS